MHCISKKEKRQFSKKVMWGKEFVISRRHVAPAARGGILYQVRRGGKNTQKNCTKKIFTTHIIMMV